MSGNELLIRLLGLLLMLVGGFVFYYFLIKKQRVWKDGSLFYNQRMQMSMILLSIVLALLGIALLVTGSF
ncbi:MAG: hypothetical protein JXR71_09775 [Bacteroidales bacterium]|nr:hypothetical protein [Bacteroidales bacterium]